VTEQLLIFYTRYSSVAFLLHARKTAFSKNKQTILIIHHSWCTITGNHCGTNYQISNTH